MKKVEKKLDDWIINSAIAVKTAGSGIFWFILKIRIGLLAAGLLYVCVFCFSRSIVAPSSINTSNSTLFTWVGVVAGGLGIWLIVGLIERPNKPLPELQPADHKVDDRLWINW